MALLSGPTLGWLAVPIGRLKGACGPSLARKNQSVEVGFIRRAAAAFACRALHLARMWVVALETDGRVRRRPSPPPDPGEASTVVHRRETAQGNTMIPPPPHVASLPPPVSRIHGTSGSGASGRTADTRVRRPRPVAVHAPSFSHSRSPHGSDESMVVTCAALALSLPLHFTCPAGGGPCLRARGANMQRARPGLLRVTNTAGCSVSQMGYARRA